MKGMSHIFWFVLALVIVLVLIAISVLILKGAEAFTFESLGSLSESITNLLGGG